MNVTNGNLSYTATMDYTQLEAAVKKIESRLAGLENAAASAGDAIDEMGGGLTKVLAAAGGVAVLKQFTTQMFNVRKSFQDTQSVMEVFLGSAEKAEEHLKELQKYAWYNMFDFETLTQASAQLQAFGTSVDDVIPIIDRLSNIAAGTKTDLMELVGSFNRAKSVGFADSRLLRSFATKGLDVVAMLRDMGMAVSDTSVTFEQLMMAVEAATNEGGRFYNLMDSQFENLSSLAGAVEDDISIMFNEIGEKMQPTMEAILKATHTLIDHYEDIGRVLAVLLTTYGAYRTALITTTIVQNLQAAGVAKLTALERVHYLWLVLQEKAQAMLNKTMLSNPYVLLATVIVGAVAALVAYTRAANSAEAQEKRMNDELEKRLEKHRELMDQSDGYIQTLKNEEASVAELAEAYEFLSKLEPFKNMSVEEIRALGFDKIKQMIDDYDFETVLSEMRAQLDSEVERYSRERYQQGGVTEKSNAGIIANRQALRAGARADNMLPLLSGLNADIINKQIAALQDLDEEQRKVKMTEFRTAIEGTNVELQKEVSEIDALRDQAYQAWKNGSSSIYDMQRVEWEYGRRYYELLELIQLNNEAIELLNRNMGDIDTAAAANTFPIFDENDPNSVVSQIKAAEEELKNLRREMLLTGNYTPEMITKIQAAEKQLSSGKDLYKTLTGRDYDKSRDTTLKYQRSAEDARIALIRDSYQRQRQTTQAEAARRIADLRKALKEEESLTAEARASINQQIASLQQKLARDLEDIDRAHIAAVRKNQKELRQLREQEIQNEQGWIDEQTEAQIALLDEGAERELRQMQLEHEQRLREIQRQRQEELDEYEELAKRKFLLENPDATEGDFYATQWNGVPSDIEAGINGKATERANAENEQYVRNTRKLYEELLVEYQDYDQRRRDIEKKYENDIRVLREHAESLPEDSAERLQYEEAIAEAERQQANALLDLDLEYGEMNMLSIKRDRLERQILATMNRIKNTSDSEEVERLTQEVQQLRQELRQVNKDIDEMNKALDVTKDIVGELTTQDVVGMFQDMSDAFVEMAGVSSDAADSISTIANGISSIAQGYASGGIVGAVVSAIGWAIDGMKSLYESTVQENEELAEFQEKLAKIKAALWDEESSIFGSDALGYAHAMVSQADWLFTKLKQYIYFYTDRIGEAVNSVYDMADFRFPSLNNQNFKDLARDWGVNYWDYETGTFNTDFIQMVLDQYGEDLTEDEKKLLQAMLNYSESYQEAMDNIASYLESLFGDVADTISEEILDSFLESGQAAVDFGNVVANVAKKMVKDLIRSMIFEQVLSQYEDWIKDVFNDKNMSSEEKAMAIMGIFASMRSDIESITPDIQAMLEGFSQFFGDLDGTSAAQGNLLQTASQDSVDMLNGQLNAIRTNQAIVSGRIDSILLQLSGIRTDMNSGFGETVRQLQEINSNTSEGGSLLRQFGIWLG